MNILVTGGAGYIGSIATEELLKAGHNVIEVARNVTGHPIPYTIGPRRAGDPAVLVASSAKIQADVGWGPRYPGLESIIGSAWEWHRRHPSGYPRV